MLRKFNSLVCKEIIEFFKKAGNEYKIRRMDNSEL